MAEDEELRTTPPTQSRWLVTEQLRLRGQAIALWNRRVPATGSNKVVVGHKLNGSALNMNAYQRGLVNGGFTSVGLKLRFPYYWDGNPNINKPRPRIKLELPWKIGNGSRIGVQFKVIEPGVDEPTSFTTFNQISNTQGIIDIPEIEFAGNQMSTFLPGWNAFEFFLSFENCIPSQTLYQSSTTNGTAWVATDLYTCVPEQLEFEFKRQLNWKTVFHPSMRVRKNVDRSQESNVLNQSSVQNLGYLGHTTGTNGIIYECYWKHDVYSDNPQNNIAFWWEVKTKDVFQYNYESGLPPFFNPSDTVGASDGGSVASINYNRQELQPTQNTPWPAAPNGNRVKAIDSPQECLVWPPKSEWDVNLSIDNTFYLPYNSKALLYLKRGTAVNDKLDQASSN